jgi:hypothetical protein
MSASSLFIITGTSKGIGKALVKHLLQAKKNKVIGISRSKMWTLTILIMTIFYVILLIYLSLEETSNNFFLLVIMIK